MKKKDKLINFRVTESEYQELHKKAAEHGMTLTDFLLMAAKKVKIVKIEGLPEVTRELRAIGNNVNQLTRLCHEGIIQCLRLDDTIKQLEAIWQLLNSLTQKGH